VRTAQQADPVRSVEMRSREAVAVIEFQRACLAAPAAMLVGERAAAAVPLEDLASSAFSKIVARSPSGMRWRSSSWTCRNLS
jgi:hypothetical protein